MTELLKQGQYNPMPAHDQVISVFAVSEGYADTVAVRDIPRFERELLPYVNAAFPQFAELVNSGKKLDSAQLDKLRGVISEFLKTFT